MENKQKNILIIYYSRTGNCKNLALNLEKKLQEDDYHTTLEEISLKKKNFKSFLQASLSALKREMPPIKELSAEPKAYPLTILISPVWANSIASPVRTFLRNYGSTLNKSFLLLTYQLFGGETALKNAILNKKGEFDAHLLLKLPLNIPKITEKIIKKVKEMV